jgi:hypothetical protein
VGLKRPRLVNLLPTLILLQVDAVPVAGSLCLGLTQHPSNVAWRTLCSRRRPWGDSDEVSVVLASKKGVTLLVLERTKV